MVTVKVSIHAGHLKIEADGHANFDHPGKDIVCASVSAIIQTAVLGLQAVAENYPNHVSIAVENPDETGII
jgi:uncharacterized protein YsxB (DUF464 family)